MKNSTDLAQNLLSKICAELIDYLKNILHSPEFIDRHKLLFDSRRYTKSGKPYQ
ncbi:hypothetical protein [uncultured Desulfobacter sp.]|uniref:hypothetical protein n=1 Tax=uncultured Desulfobacter sp. TaxID=240139 RepID=UPI0029F4A80B|nr:hypothetical protein [uncultured Desulfobacter sp.]